MASSASTAAGGGVLLAGLAGAALVAAAWTTPAAGQRAAELDPEVRARYVAMDAPVLALMNVKVIDGTGAPARDGQAIILRDGRITEVADAALIDVPGDAEVHDLSGHTVIPGLIGLHDHLFYTAAGGRSAQMTFTGPRLYLGSGVTTIRTTGSRAPYDEINLREGIELGEVPGPRVHITAPYITGGHGANSMVQVNSPEAARRFVAYWSEEGATWLKAYTNIGSAELKAAIDEAHARGMKVTGHICSVTFREAVALGIDNLEHGLFTNSDYAAGKQRDECPTNVVTRVGLVDVNGPEVARTFRDMIDAGVAMTSTLAVYELFVPNRPTKDERTLRAMAPEVREDYLAARARIDEGGQTAYTADIFRNAMAYERAFHAAGGLLAAGVDPTGNGGALPGFGDQRNYELLSEAGFSPEEVVRIMTLNGARVLGVDGELGSIEPGKLADLMVIPGDLTTDPSLIRGTRLVFKDGVGYDSARLIGDVEGRVGIH
ncbi:MAG TPA: amidohydrolase family protein [Longimicrobiales bacterium]|nr:amidohydrolase family protein [Longimicrobiales bacterium]